jgi:hypothetical protein
MSTSLPNYRSALLLCTTVFLLAARSVTADQIKYYLVPFSYEDSIHANNDTLTGTITVSAVGGIFGTYSYGGTGNEAITVSTDFTMTSSDHGILPLTASGSKTLDNILSSGSVTFSAAGIDLYPSATFWVNYPASSSPFVSADWAPHDNVFFVSAGPDGVTGMTMQIHDTDVSSNFVGGVWTIATVPEPGTLALLGVAIMGLGGGRLVLRRNRVRR